MEGIKKSPLRILSASLIFLVISQLLHMVGLTISMDYYGQADFYGIWSPLLISTGNMTTGLSFFYVNIILGFIGAVLFVVVFTVLVRGLKGGPAERGVLFGLLVFLVAIVPDSFSVFMLLNVPLEIIIFWTLESFIIFLVGGALTGCILVNRPKKAGKKKKWIDFGGQAKGPEKHEESGEPDWMKQQDAGDMPK
jgi:hypothetical protein